MDLVFYSCINQGSPEKRKNRRYLHLDIDKGVYLRNWLTWLQSGSPMVCLCLLAGKPGKLGLKLRPSPKAWESGELMVYIPAQGQGKTGVPDQQGESKRHEFLLLFLCSIQTFNRLLRPTHTGEGNLLSSMAHLIWKHPYRFTQKLLFNLSTSWPCQTDT